MTADGLAALAYVNHELVGFAEVSIRRDYVEGATSAPVPYLEGCFVTESNRKQGIGIALLNFIERWAHEQGYAELASDADPSNTRSILMHSKFGFRDVGRSVHFVKSLAPKLPGQTPGPIKPSPAAIANAGLRP